MYAPGTPPGAYLRQYSHEFGTVEVDSTFYGVPAVERLRRWAQAVPADFTFALKVPREITHERRLMGCEKLVAEFFSAALALGAQLEAVLVQLPPDFGPESWDALAAFVRGLEFEARIAVELRDPRWFEIGRHTELRALLSERGIALAVSDGTFVELNVMLAAFAQPTARFGYIRWLGRRASVARFDRVSIDRGSSIARWSAVIEAVGTRLERVCGYANNHYMGHGPATVRAVYHRLGIERARPARFVQGELFSNGIS